MPTERAMRAAEILRMGGWPAAVKNVKTVSEGLDLMLDLPALEAVAEAARQVMSIEIDMRIRPIEIDSGMHGMLKMDCLDRLCAGLGVLRAALANLEEKG